MRFGFAGVRCARELQCTRCTDLRGERKDPRNLIPEFYVNIVSTR
jgi:hypothetical protein